MLEGFYHVFLWHVHAPLYEVFALSTDTKLPDNLIDNIFLWADSPHERLARVDHKILCVPARCVGWGDLLLFVSHFVLGWILVVANDTSSEDIMFPILSRSIVTEWKVVKMTQCRPRVGESNSEYTHKDKISAVDINNCGQPGRGRGLTQKDVSYLTGAWQRGLLPCWVAFFRL